MEYKIVVVWNALLWIINDSLSTSQLTMSKHLKFQVINVATNDANITVQEVKFKQ